MVDTIFEEAESLVCEQVLVGAAVFYSVEVAGEVFISPSVSVFCDSHHAVSKGLSVFSSHWFGLPNGKAKEKVGKSPLYLGIVIYYHLYIPVLAVTVTIGRPTVYFILGLWPNAIT